jgi:four helix bundle protein
MEENSFMHLEEPEKVYNIRHRAFLFSKEIIRFVGAANYERIHFSIFDQLIRSATSVGANLVEGSAGASTNDFLKYYVIALKSANETKYWLCLVRDTLTKEPGVVSGLITEAEEISKIIASIIIRTKNRPKV